MPEPHGTRPKDKFDSAHAEKAEQQLLLAQSAIKTFIEDPYFKKRYGRDPEFAKYISFASGTSLLGDHYSSRLWMSAVHIHGALEILNRNHLPGFHQLKAELKMRLAESGMGLMDLHPKKNGLNGEYITYFATQWAAGSHAEAAAKREAGRSHKPRKPSKPLMATRRQQTSLV